MKIEDIYNKYEFQLFKRHVIIYEDVDDETKERIKNYLKELIEDLYKLDFVRSVSVNKCFEPEDPTVDDIELLVSFDKEYDLKERINKLKEIWRLKHRIEEKYELSFRDIDIHVDENRWN
jgi:hypothetical protein